MRQSNSGDGLGQNLCFLRLSWLRKGGDARASIDPM